MNISEYTFQKANLDEDWNNFVKRSPQGTIFTRKAFLEASVGKLGLWYCLKGEEIKAAICLQETDDGKSTRKVPHFIHNGILFASFEELSPVDRANEEFKLSAFVVSELNKIYKHIDFTNYHNVCDLRPFQWHNYGTDGPKASIDIRYTSLIELPEASADWDAFLKTFNSTRRRSIRSGIKEGVQVESGFDLDLFLSLYKQTFAYQDIGVESEELDLVVGIISSLNNAGLIEMLIAKDGDGMPASVGVFAKHKETAFYLYGANSRESKSHHVGSVLFFEAFKKLSSQGIRIFDFEGVNSPLRGYFKSSFGGKITPYYRIYWDSE